MNTIRLWGVVLLALVVARGGSAQEKVAVSQPALDATLLRVKQILQEPLVPPGVRNKPLVKEPRDGFGNYAYRIDRKNVAATEIADTVALIPRDAGIVDFFLNISEEESEVLVEPKWPEVVAKVDALVEKYFPGLKRKEALQEAFGSARLNRGIFTLTYAKAIQDVEVQSVTVELRLTDGKIARVITTTSPLEPNTVIPPPVPAAQLVKAAEKALKAAHSDIGQLTLMTARREWAGTQNNKPILGYRLALKGQEKTRFFFVFALYSERTGEVTIDRTREVSPQDTLGRVSPRVTSDAAAKPEKIFTAVEDVQPTWGKDGTLFFQTRRDVKGRPWTHRTFPTVSVAMQPVGTHELTLLRPFKPLGVDAGSVTVLALSPRYWALQFNEKGFGVLDTHKGQYFLPVKVSDPNPYLTPAINRRFNDNFEFGVASASWLPDETGLVASFYLDPLDKNIYLMRREGDTPQKWRISPLVKQLGEDILPRLATDTKTLAWCHQLDDGKTKKVDNEPPPVIPWELTVAAFDMATSKVGTRKSLRLDSEPQSLSWDDKGKRWLVVTQNQMLWVKEEGEALVASPTPELNWKNQKLKVLSAAVSPQGDRVAVSAQLETPQTFPQTECVVYSLVFNWDGVNSQVAPFYDPSLNGLPRYSFQGTQTPWAKVYGDASKYGFERYIEPTEVVTAIP